MYRLTVVYRGNFIHFLCFQILREYPDLFSQRNSKERKRRLYFVLRFVCYVHNARRSQNRTLKNQKRKKVQALTAFIDKLETGDTREEPIELLDSDSEVSASDDLLPVSYTRDQFETFYLWH